MMTSLPASMSVLILPVLMRTPLPMSEGPMPRAPKSIDPEGDDEDPNSNGEKGPLLAAHSTLVPRPQIDTPWATDSQTSQPNNSITITLNHP